MADITVTAANVIGYGPTSKRNAGETITAGDLVIVASDGGLEVASDDSAANAAVVGVALNGGAAGQPVVYQTSGNVNPGGTVAVGKVYVASTDGGFAPVDDIAGTEYITVVGVGITASLIKLGINQSGVAAAGAVA